MGPIAELIAPAAWRSVDLISDLHLQARDAQTFAAWQGYLQTTPADAVFILGDLFEVWVGDDACDEPGFEAQCAEVLRQASRRVPLFFMHGNRDFLLGEQFAARCGLQLIDDPTTLQFAGRRWLLTHGDWLCIEDQEYLRFRAEVRAPEWQQRFLAQPLAQRRKLARAMRARSEAHKSEPGRSWADVDAATATDWLEKAQASILVHGHTHRPGVHELPQGRQRIVLSDWDVAAHPPRAQVLCLGSTGYQRVDLR